MQLFEITGKTTSLILFVLVMGFTLAEIIKKSKQKNLFLLLLFYYYGYMILSYFNKGIMLVDYVYLLVPLSVIWLSA